jgi:hypothetical protein
MAATAEKMPTYTSTDIKHDSPLSSPLSIEEGQQKDIGTVLTHDEYHLATLGYKQEFIRSLGFFESCEYRGRTAKGYHPDDDQKPAFLIYAFLILLTRGGYIHVDELRFWYSCALRMGHGTLSSRRDRVSEHGAGPGGLLPIPTPLVFQIQSSDIVLIKS